MNVVAPNTILRPFLCLVLAAPCAAQSTFVLLDTDPSGQLFKESFTAIDDGDVLLGSAALAPNDVPTKVAYGPPGAFQIISTPVGYGWNALFAWGAAEFGVGELLTLTPFGIQSEGCVYFGGIAIPVNSLITDGSTAFITRAFDVNSNGRIVCEARFESWHRRATIFDDGNVLDLGALFGPTERSVGLSINEQGQVVGKSFVPLYQSLGHATLWDNGSIIDLHDPTQILGDDSTAQVIDNFGRIAGSAQFVPNGPPVAALWANGTITNLGTLPGGTWSAVIGGNDLGSIVGQSDDSGSPPASSNTKAVLWKNGQIVDLNQFTTPGRTIRRAISINNDGTILVVTDDATQPGVDVRYELLKPVCAGGSTTYGTGCPGSGSRIPNLFVQNCPTPGNTFALRIEDGRPHASTMILLGSGTGSAPIVPACSVQVLPLTPAFVSLALDDTGACFLPVPVPNGTPAVTLSLQAFCADSGASGGVSASRPIQLIVN